uniref:Peptidase A2 domain-containing protein n=1 Tax=Nothobranchius furzeri TaxID=105023 RepID=A0A8C6LYF6_NOTFU
MGRCVDPCDSADWNRDVFSARRRWHNESVREFRMALQRSAVKAYPTADPNTQDLLAKDQFIAHVGNGDMRVSLRSAKPASLEAAINLAAELELIKGLETSSVSDARVRGMTEKDADEESITSLMGVVESLRQEAKSLQNVLHTLSVPAASGPHHDAQNTNLQPSREYSQKKGNGRLGGCWECCCNRHIRRDIRRDCPYVQDKEGARTVGQMPAPLSVVETPIGRGNSGYLKARIGGCECQVLIDTGASHSVISRKLWLSFTRGGCELTPYGGNVTAANGGGMCIMGCWQTTCQLGPLAFVVEFLVSDIPSDEVLLGFDFLSKHGMVVDLGTKTCKIMGRVFPLLDLEPFLSPQVVVVQTDTVVPPRSEAIISGQIKDSWGDYARGLLEPSDHLSKRCDLLVERVICKVDQGQLPVRVMNVSDDPLILKGGMRVGTLFTDVEVEDERTDRVKEGQGSQPWTVESLMTQFRVGERGFAAEEVSVAPTKSVSIQSRGYRFGKNTDYLS